MPRALADLAEHDLIGGDADPQVMRGLQSLGLTIDRGDFRYRCDDRFTAWQLLNANCGIGAAQLFQARASRDLVRVLPDLPTIKLPVWLTSHSELKTSARVRRTFDYIATELSAELKAQE